MSFKKLMLHSYIATCALVSGLYASGTLEMFKDSANRIIALKNITNPHAFAEAAPIFTLAFLKAYIPYTNEMLRIPQEGNRVGYLSEIFVHEEFIPFCQQKKLCVIGAFQDDNLIGYISCNVPTSLGELYIRQLVVDPYYWRNGIGKKLVFSPLKMFPYVKTLTAVMQRINEGSRNFYRELGFRVYATYDHPKDDIAYTKTIDAVKHNVDSRGIRSEVCTIKSKL